MRSRLRPCVLGSAIVFMLTGPVMAGTQGDAELLAQMQQEVQRLQQQAQTANTQCQAGQRRACEQVVEHQERLARVQQLIEGCQKEDRESCTQLRTLRRR
jgi:hypothetical protein